MASRCQRGTWEKGSSQEQRSSMGAEAGGILKTPGGSQPRPAPTRREEGTLRPHAAPVTLPALLSAGGSGRWSAWSCQNAPSGSKELPSERWRKEASCSRSLLPSGPLFSPERSASVPNCSAWLPAPFFLFSLSSLGSGSRVHFRCPGTWW